MNFGSMLPLVGLDGNGNTVNMLMSADGTPNTAGYVDSYDSSTFSEYVSVTIKTLFKSSIGTVAIGEGSLTRGSLVRLAWNNVGGWKVGTSPVSGPIKFNGVTYKDGGYLIANGTSIYKTDMVFGTGNPLDGYSPTVPSVINTAIWAPADNLTSNSTLVVGASTASTGTWSPVGAIVANGVWDHNVGEAVNLKTGHLKTTYTFPGYGGANPQTQTITAIPNGDAPPTDWDLTTQTAQGYFGLGGCPTATVTWETPPA